MTGINSNSTLGFSARYSLKALNINNLNASLVHRGQEFKPYINLDTGFYPYSGQGPDGYFPFIQVPPSIKYGADGLKHSNGTLGKITPTEIPANMKIQPLVSDSTMAVGFAETDKAGKHTGKEIHVVFDSKQEGENFLQEAREAKFIK